RESAGTEDREKAERILRKRVGLANTPHFVDPTTQRLTFDNLAEGYLRDYRLNRKRSLRDAERHVRYLSQVFGLDRAVAITSERVAAYSEARLGEGARPATINRELAALRRMFRLAEETLRYRPRIRLLAEDNVREGFFEPADFEAVCRHLPADVVDVVRFAYLVGWRRGEIRTLEWRDVNLERLNGAVVGGAIRLRASQSKNKRGRVLALRDQLLELLVRRAELRRLDCPHVFHRNGHPVRDFRAAWKNACAAAGMPGRLFHDLRRSAVRNMVRAGVPERVAMAISGHRTRSVFDRYNIVSEDDIAAAVERTGAYVAREGEKERRVEPLAAAAGQHHGENTESGAHRAAARTVTSARNRVDSRSAGREARTPTALRPTDFKSVASASSAIPAIRRSARSDAARDGSPNAGDCAQTTLATPSTARSRHARRCASQDPLRTGRSFSYSRDGHRHTPPDSRSGRVSTRSRSGPAAPSATTYASGTNTTASRRPRLHLVLH